MTHINNYSIEKEQDKHTTSSLLAPCCTIYRVICKIQTAFWTHSALNVACSP